MGFEGLKYNTLYKTPVRSLNGFYGIRIKFNLIGVRITDERGFGLPDVHLRAINPSSGIPFENITNSSGTAFMQLDSNTNIIITKNHITKTVNYLGVAAPVYIIDLPILESM